MTAVASARRLAPVSVEIALGAVALSQLLLAFGYTAAGSIAAAAVMTGLLTQGLLAGRLGEESGARPRPGDPSTGALGALALLPLMALLDTAHPFGRAHPVANALVVAVGMAVAVGVSMHPAPLRSLRSSLWVSPPQILIGLTGVPLGLVTFVAVRPEAVAGTARPLALAGAVAVAALLGAVAELVLRGVVQTGLGPALGSRGILATAALSAGAAGVSGSAALAASAGLVGALYGWFLHRTDSLWGTCVSHGLLFATFVACAGM